MSNTIIKKEIRKYDKAPPVILKSSPIIIEAKYNDKGLMINTITIAYVMMKGTPTEISSLPK